MGNKTLIAVLLLSIYGSVCAETVCIKDEAWLTNQAQGQKTEKCTNQPSTNQQQFQTNPNSRGFDGPALQQSMVQNWIITPNDQNFRQLIEKWAKQAGWVSVWQVDKDIPIDTATQFNGQFKQAVRYLLSSTVLTDLALKPCFHSNNVVRIVRETAKCQPTE